MAKLMILEKGKALQWIDLPAELVGTAEAPSYRPGAKMKEAHKAPPDPGPESGAADDQTEPVDDLDALTEADLRARYKAVVGSPAGNRSLDTMRAAIRERLAAGG